MRHLPNLLTLANLFCGCIAIAFILNSQPFLAGYNGEEYWVTGTEQAYWGAIFIGIAAICDMLDGAAARALNILSPIGKDLDSLADLVSFGVAPSMILFKMLWAANISQPHAMDVSMVAMAPAFILACFAALRLARFNITNTQQTSSFIGMPVPAVGIFIASFPLINFSNPALGLQLQNRWVLYLVIALFSWLMVSRIRFIKFMPSKWKLAYFWPQLTILLVGLGSIPVLKVAAILPAFAVYIILSLVYKPKEA